MEYLGFVLGIFGLIAYLQQSTMKKRIDELERQLVKIKGTSFHDERQELLRASRAYVGEKVDIELKEDHEDADIMMYGNTKHGSNTILDMDEEWMLVRVETPKGSKTKLIRTESVKRISANKES